MPQSEQIGELAKALAETQAEMKAPPKSKVMKIPGRGDYRYADLADVIEARRVGSKHGLAFTQGMEMRDGYLALTTALMHSSGQWKSWECPIPAGLKPQELGSYLTYMRRYSECAAWGIAAEDDDDGAAAQDAQPVKKAEPKSVNGALVTATEADSVRVALKRAGVKTAEDAAKVLTNIVGVGKAADVPKAELANVLDALRQMAEHAEVRA